MSMTESERQRLEAAERVCLLFGWTSLGDGSDRADALIELWREWVDLVPDIANARHRRKDLTDEKIRELAERRRARRAAALFRSAALFQSGQS